MRGAQANRKNIWFGLVRLEFLAEFGHGKNLLAFSHGIDSTALFYLLKDAGVEFDCALVNYKTRSSSDDEECAARELCAKFGKKIFVKIADLKDSANFEFKARAFRYEFFERICADFGYENLILGHQLNDAFEWFLMQFAKGAGLANSLLDGRSERGNLKIFRPLIYTPKSALKSYLDGIGARYFIDESNLDVKFRRNYFRSEFSDEFISKFAKGASESFKMLSADKSELLGEFSYEFGGFFLIDKNQKSLNLIDKACKKLGVVISKKQREQIARSDCVLSGKIVVASNEKFYFVCEFIQTPMPKNFKEACRKARIPPLARGFLSRDERIFNSLYKLLAQN